MKPVLAAALFILVSIAAAHAFGLGEGNRFGKLGAMSKGVGTVGPLPAGSILRIDAVSHILRIDGTSKICRIGGC